VLRLTHVEIENFRSIKELEFDPARLCALIGPNNAGKSNILAALDLLLGQRYPTDNSLTEDDFYRRDLDNKPRIAASFEYVDEGGYDAQMRIEFGPEPTTGDLKLRYWGEGEIARYVSRELRERFGLIRLDVNRNLRQHQPTNQQAGRDVEIESLPDRAAFLQDLQHIGRAAIDRLDSFDLRSRQIGLETKLAAEIDIPFP